MLKKLEKGMQLGVEKRIQKKEKYLESMNFNHYQLKKIKKERSEEHLE